MKHEHNPAHEYLHRISHRRIDPPALTGQATLP
jgi:hypothetical protein